MTISLRGERLRRRESPAAPRLDIIHHAGLAPDHLIRACRQQRTAVIFSTTFARPPKSIARHVQASTISRAARPSLPRAAFATTVVAWCEASPRDEPAVQPHPPGKNRFPQHRRTALGTVRGPNPPIATSHTTIMDAQSGAPYAGSLPSHNCLCPTNRRQARSPTTADDRPVRGCERQEPGRGGGGEHVPPDGHVPPRNTEDRPSFANVPALLLFSFCADAAIAATASGLGAPPIGPRLDQVAPVRPRSTAHGPPGPALCWEASAGTRQYAPASAEVFCFRVIDSEGPACLDKDG